MTTHFKDLWRITVADAVVRTGYQIGKTPLLPLYATFLGASDLIVGYVVSISTLTGLVLKPLVGALSDHTGRRWLLLLGLVLFTGVPFLYRFVETPQDLYAVRLLHGTATAVFGPVSLAYVAEMGAARRAERLGIFGMGRSFSYLSGPLIGAALLQFLPAEQAFTLIGLISCLALLPGLRLTESVRIRPRVPLGIAQMMTSISSSRSFWLVAGLEIVVHIVSYALKAFLPLYALQAVGHNLIMIGAFFTLQEAVQMVVRPWAGRMADRHGHQRLIFAGLVVLTLAMSLLAYSDGAALWAVAFGMGAGIALILPATLSMLTAEVRPDGLGAGMGALGAMRNLAKVLGPVLGGLILTGTSYQGLFALAALLLGMVAFVYGWLGRAARSRGQAGR